MKAFVYLLVCQDMFKIGKAVDIENRYHLLKKNYDFNLDASYSIETDKAEAYRLEKTLHFIFASYRITTLPKAEGYTEFFNISCLDDVLETIKHLSTHKEIQVHKGITLRPQYQNPDQRSKSEIAKMAIEKIMAKPIEERIDERQRETRKRYPNFIPIRLAILYVYYALKYATETKEEIKTVKIEETTSDGLVKEETVTCLYVFFIYRNISKNLFDFLNYSAISKKILFVHELHRKGRVPNGIGESIRPIFSSCDHNYFYSKNEESEGCIKTVLEFYPKDFIKYFNKNEPKTDKERYVEKYIQRLMDIWEKHKKLENLPDQYRYDLHDWCV